MSYVCEKCGTNREFESIELFNLHKDVFHKDDKHNSIQEDDSLLEAKKRELEVYELENKLVEENKMGVKELINKIRQKDNVEEIKKLNLNKDLRIKSNEDIDSYQYELKLITTSNELMNKMSTHFEDLSRGYKGEGHKAKLLRETKVLEGQE